MNNQPKTFDNFDFNRVELTITRANWNDFVNTSLAGKRYILRKSKIDRKIIENFIYSNFYRLILWGLQGRGKSHLAKAILNQNTKRCNIYNEKSPYYGMQLWELEKEGIIFSDMESAQDLYEIFFNLQPHIEFEIQQKANSELRYMTKAMVLLIDDIGSEKETEREVFPQGLLKLLDNYAGKLIVTTNLAPLSLLSRYKAKIFSRLFENALVICVSGPDSRLLPGAGEVKNDKL